MTGKSLYLFRELHKTSTNFKKFYELETALESVREGFQTRLLE
jgi:hypothetical protein